MTQKLMAVSTGGEHVVLTVYDEMRTDAILVLTVEQAHALGTLLTATDSRHSFMYDLPLVNATTKTEVFRDWPTDDDDKGGVR